MTQPIRRVLIQEKLADAAPRTFQDTPTMRTHATMSKGLLRGLTLAAFAALGTMTFVASAGAATRVETCMDLKTFGETYVLTANLATSCGTCLVVANDRITIDLAGRTISPLTSCAGVGAGITDGGIARQGTTVKNGTVTDFENGVLLAFSTRNQILNLTSSANSFFGIILGARSLVKGCLVEGNEVGGILIGEFGQVQDCIIGGLGGPEEPEGNGGDGIAGTGHLLITNNTVLGNQTGIRVGPFSTVSFNESSNNAVLGVLAADHSLVTGNITMSNGTAGIATDGLSSVSSDISNGNEGGGIDIQVQCPSTVTNNDSDQTDGKNYQFNGPARCQTNNNH